ncbi:hypothetical protein QYM36_019360 [Artemia franciscana]|uniref:Cullin-5 n=1 Tax=Artemia franciscana TaxID=6661 RepID=A0AA88H7E7_ARTSF|nr:hypothetical protein QYM36_019360 [Artemia franciscana]
MVYANERIRQHQNEQDLLNGYTSEWSRFWTQCCYLQLPFNGLDSVLQTLSRQRNINAPEEEPVPSGMGKRLLVSIWNKSIFSSIRVELLDEALGLVNKERCNEKINSSQFIAVKESYVNLCLNTRDKLQLYIDHFEKAYIDSTRSFYLRQAGSYLLEHGREEYIKYAYTKLNEEEQRASKYLEPVSQKKLQNCCLDVLVRPFKETISSECQYLSSYSKTEGHRLLFLVACREPGGTVQMLLDLEQQMFKSGHLHIMENANNINQDPEKFVNLLVFIFHRFSQLVNETFNGNPRFLAARDEAFKKVVNDIDVFTLDIPSSRGATTRLPELRCPELLADYFDKLLRKTRLRKRLTSDEIDSRLKDALLILKYIQNKDVLYGLL